MRMVDLIHKKRRGEELTDEEIRFFVNGVTDGSLPDYQISAFCMAVVFQGMSDRETATLTDAMAHSGDEIDLSEFGTLSVDKHSTGGVGDKTSLILAPIVAACGAKTAKMSGRGLGHTGGTVDKLESIPGYRVELSIDEFLKQSREIGVCVIGQSADLAPADKRLYALRDVTGTVEAIPLIVSSIMSKKLAAGAHSIVLDVTVGSGAFMKDIASAEELAQKMVDIGRRCGRNMAAIISNMDEPLGHAIGNTLEVIEAISVLKGETKGDVYEISLELAAAMLSLVHGIPHGEARAMANEAVASGRAFEKFREWIRFQGGDESFVLDVSRFPKAHYSHEVLSPESGFITRMETEAIGNAAGLLGAGRMTKSDKIDMAAGIILDKKTGESVKKGERLCTLYTEKEDTLGPAEEEFLRSFSFGRKAPEEKPLIYRIIR